MMFSTFLIAAIFVEVIQSFKYPFNRIPTSKVLFTNIDSTLGTPSERPFSSNYLTQEGVKITCEVEDVKNPTIEIEGLISSLDNTKGVLLTSSYEYPGRYARWTVGFNSPPIQIEGKELSFKIIPLNVRGQVIIRFIHDHLVKFPELFKLSSDIKSNILIGEVVPSDQFFNEEERSKQPSIFSLIRKIKDLFYSKSASQLGLYGAFGYDLTFQFEPIKQNKVRSDDQRDLVLYLPDEVFVVDNYRRDAWKIRYDFEKGSQSTFGMDRQTCESRFVMASSDRFEERDTPQGQYAKNVLRAKEEFRVGNLFEVVISQVFRRKLVEPPSVIFSRLLKRNPSPYGFLMNLDRNEYLIGASPEMFVRAESNAKGMRIETCPISGTIERGGDPLEDAQQIKKLLMNPKEESELTMCTDVDRNDKSRICEPGTIRVLGRRQIEMYSKLIHTVDHVEGYLRKEFDALDALLCHTWAVTVTGAPKTWAIRFVEQIESSVRHWYGGAVGFIGFDGNLNTGLTLRTIRVKDGIGEVRAGATLLHDSDPMAEEKETELKASAMLESMVPSSSSSSSSSSSPRSVSQNAMEYDIQPIILLVDHEDSFVHTLADYLRQTGSDVTTCRCGQPLDDYIIQNIDSGKKIPSLVVLSPGPGSPSDFKLSDTIDKMIKRKIPIFGVCLGLQGIVEHFGGKLGILPSPVHGKTSVVTRLNSDEDPNATKDILRGLPKEFQVGRYHSLYGEPETFKNLKATAKTSDGVVMALQHEYLPIAAVQFHPESILTLPKTGFKILTNAIDLLKSKDYPK